MPPELTSADDPRLPRIVLALILILATLVAYSPSFPGDFIWDDDAHVTQNETLRTGQGLVDIWTIETEPSYRPRTPQYYPVAFSALWLQFRFFGLEATGYHVVNLLIHIANALLVWAVFARLRMRWAWLVGVLFAVHPMHVETAAWVMEIKNLLSAFFYLLAAYFYLRFDERWNADRDGGHRAFSRGWYAIALASFLLGLLSKTIICTLPAALVLAMLFRRDRLDLRRLAPLAPFLVLGVALALQTSYFEHHGNVNASGPEFEYGLADRLLISTRVILFYPWKLAVPWPMLFNYPRWEIRPEDLLQWWSVLAVLVVAAGAVVLWLRGRRGVALGLAFFAGSVFPALGLIVYYPMMFSFVADHFCYLPSLGILALFAGLVGYVLPDRRSRWGTAALMVGSCTILTWFQAGNFRDAETLYRHSLKHNPDGWLAQHQLAATLMRRALQGGAAFDSEAVQADLREARELLERAVERKDTHFMLFTNLASVSFLLGDPRAALTHAKRAVELKPEHVQAVSMVGPIHQALGELEEARDWAGKTLELDATDFRSNLLLGQLFKGERRPEEAVPHLTAACFNAPDPGSKQAALRELLGALQGMDPSDAIATIDQHTRDEARADLDLLNLKVRLLDRQRRYAEAIALTERLITEARRRGLVSRIAPLRAQLDQLRAALASGSSK